MLLSEILQISMSQGKLLRHLYKDQSLPVRLPLLVTINHFLRQFSGIMPSDFLLLFSFKAYRHSAAGKYAYRCALSAALYAFRFGYHHDGSEVRRGRRLCQRGREHFHPAVHIVHTGYVPAAVPALSMGLRRFFREFAWSFQSKLSFYSA